MKFLLVSEFWLLQSIAFTLLFSKHVFAPRLRGQGSRVRKGRHYALTVTERTLCVESVAFPAQR